jgi:CHAT domain-containing protein
VGDGASTELLTRFHANLKGGQTPVRALRNSQISLLHGSDARFRSSSAWGAFQILGGTSL